MIVALSYHLMKLMMMMSGFASTTETRKDTPLPIRLAVEPAVPYTLQLVVLPTEDPVMFHIMKHINFHGNKIDIQDCKSYCHGECQLVDFGKNYRNGLMAFQYMLERLMGFQIRYHVIQSTVKRAASMCAGVVSRADGYKFIREKGPRANNQNQFQEWADIQCNEKVDSPVYGWQEARVKEALGNYYKGRANAKTLDFWMLTLKDFAGWFLNDVLKLFIRTLRQNGIVWLGKSRIGKSNGSKTVSFEQSFLEITESDRTDLIASFVTAKHFDFFKAEPVFHRDMNCN